MKNTTPFFPFFRGLLFGRPPRRAHERLQQQAQKLQCASFGKLTGLFGKYIPSRLLEPAENGTGSRQRSFSTQTTFWTFLAQVLNPEGSCREALRKLQAWLAASTSQSLSASSSAYCQARRRLPQECLHEIHKHVAYEVDRQLRGTEEFGRPVKLVDGTGVSMPDTQDNQEAWPQTKAQKPGCGFPFARLVALFNLSNGVLLDWAEGNKHDGEAKLFRSLWDQLNPGDVLVGDRGFCSYVAMASLLQNGVDTVMRIHQSRAYSFAQGKGLGPGDRLIHWKRPAKCPKGLERSIWEALPQTLALRLVEVKVDIPGFRVGNFVVVTTLLDPIEWPVEKLGRIYFRRWAVELFFRDIKTSLGMDILRCKTPEMVRKEITMHVIAYNCIRGVMQEAATTYQSALGRMSFKGAIGALRQWGDAIQIHHDKPRKQAEMIKALMRVLAEDTSKERPNRYEPRAKKRRPKGYSLMNKPRD